MTGPQPWDGSPRSRAVAWSLAGIVLLGFGALSILDYRRSGWSGLGAELVTAVLLVAFFAGLGTLLALRQPGNAIGWLLLAGGLTWLSSGLVGNYAKHALAGGDLSAPVRLAATYDDSSWTLGMACSVGLPLLLFPAGRTRSRGWSWVARLMVAGTVLALLGSAVYAGPVLNPADPSMPVDNPWGLDRLAGVSAAVRGVGVSTLMATILVAGVGIAIRFRSTSGAERQQLRWVRAGAVLAVSGMVTVFVGGGLLGLSAGVTDTLVTIGIGCIPMSLSVAVLRYRLYDLDRVVSRTVTYAALSGLLVATYVAGVAGVSRLTPSGNSFAVAASTLTVAALFQPLRRRVQRWVDRRFNRARYDAEQTVDAFARRLREQVDLDVVRSDLLAVATGTMQPLTASLWLRPVGPTS